MKQRRVLSLCLAVVVVTTGLWLIFLLGSDVSAPTADRGREGCGGSAVSVARRGTGYLGGELRTDEKSFDKACVARAEARLRLLPFVGGAFALSSAAAFLYRRKTASKRSADKEGAVQTPFVDIV